MNTLTFDFLRGYQRGDKRESDPIAYQWDTGNELAAQIPETSDSIELQYWQRGMSQAVAYEPGSTSTADNITTVTGNIPNSLFEQAGPISVYIISTTAEHGVTTYEGVINVQHRAQPDDYVDDDPDNEAVHILAAATEAAETAEAAAETCTEVLESIPADYTTLSNDVSDLKADFSALVSGEITYNNLSVNLGSAVNNSTGGVASFPAYTTWATSDLIAIPEGATSIESNFNEGVGASSTFGFSIYSSTDTNNSFVVGGQDLSVLTIGSNYKYIRMTNYDANSSHSGLYITFSVESPIQNINDDIGKIAIKSDSVVTDFYAETNTEVKRVEITNITNSTISSFTGVNTGRNLVSHGFTSETTINNVKFTPNADGSVTVNGTASDNAYIVYGTFFAPVNTGEKFRLFGCAMNGGATRHRMYLTASGFATYDYGEGVEFTVSGKALSLVIYIPKGEKAENLVFYPMVTHNDYSDVFEKPVFTSYSISAQLAQNKTLIIENGKMFIDGAEIGTAPVVKSKSEFSHFWAYSTTNEFDVKVVSFEDQKYVNDEIEYLNTIHSPYKALKNKKVVTYGDSLTWYDGNAFTWGKLQGAYCYGYQFYLREVLGMLTTNRGASGETSPQICARIKQASDLDEYDYLIMMSGDNDDRLGVSIGTLQPIGGTFDTSTLIGALQSAIEYALSENPKLRIILMTQPMGWTYESNALDRVSVLIPTAYKNVAEQYGLPLINLYMESGINELTRNTLYLDPPDTENNLYMYHPNNDGWKRLSRIICSQIVLY